jgi:hypothetical protein
MPDMERFTDQLTVDVAKIGGKVNGKSADYWDGYRNGKSRARWEVAIVFAIIYFSIAALRLRVKKVGV